MIQVEWNDGRLVRAQHAKEEDHVGCYDGWGMTNYFRVNPNQTYEFSIWIRSPGACVPA